uniref:Peroxisomal membrane protein PMP34 n=1 Tax=Arion vulgaris TaxID=1028688 RepID=A0A0B7B7G0_9EUPU
MENVADKAGGLMNLFSYSNLVHAVSGAAGSVIAISVFYPLDTVRTRLQVDDHRRAKHTFEVLKDIIKEEGINGICRGWLSMAGTILVSSFIYFYTYASFQYVHHSIIDTQSASSTNKHIESLHTMFVDLLIAFLAGVVNVLMSSPLWVANTRLKLQGAKLYTAHYNKKDDTRQDAKHDYNGTIDCIVKIIQKEGIKTLWGGTVPSILLATNPAIQFMVYEALKRYFTHMLNVSELNGLLYFLLGAIAKTVATVITYPLQVVQSRLRAGYAKLESSLSLIENILHLIKTRGIGALYKGMEAKLLQTVLTAALMFLIYEKISAFIFQLMSVK